MISIFCGLNKAIINHDLVIDGDFNIIKNTLELEEIRDERTIVSIGTIQHESLSRKPVLLQRLLLGGEEVNPIHLIKNFRGYFQHFLLSIWLLKDNAINLEDIVFIDKNKELILTDKNPVLFSNSQGEYKSVYLSQDDILGALRWFERLKPSFIRDEDPITEKEDSVILDTRINNSNKEIDYLNYNRLQRAIRFVLLARSESFPPAKVTFYISALEALFSNSNEEVKFQVADRTTRVLSEVYEERIKINKIISIAYSFRSVYIHGSVDTKKQIRKTLKPYETIEDLSIELDTILRTVLKRFLSDLNYVVHMDDASFSVWIKELLYK